MLYPEEWWQTPPHQCHGHPRHMDWMYILTYSLLPHSWQVLECNCFFKWHHHVLFLNVHLITYCFHIKHQIDICVVDNVISMSWTMLDTDEIWTWYTYMNAYSWQGCFAGSGWCTYRTFELWNLLLYYFLEFCIFRVHSRCMHKYYIFLCLRF